jgi:uncharacterized membrane protein required for colicin V production
MIARLLILAASLVVALLILGPATKVLTYLPFLQKMAEAANEAVIRPLLPLTGSLSEAIQDLALPDLFKSLLLSRFPDPDSPLVALWPQLSSALARFLMTSLTFLVLLGVISLLIHTIVSLLTDVLDRVPIVGGLNHLAGLLVGLVHGMLILMIFLLVGGLLSPYFPQLGALLADSELASAFYRQEWTSFWASRLLQSL